MVLKENSEAKKVFDKLPPSARKEMVRYLSSLKTEESVARNVNKAIGFLMGKERFVGRELLNRNDNSKAVEDV